MQCPFCKNENPEDSKFCFNCGNNLEAAAAITSQEQADPSLYATNVKVTARTKVILAAILILFIGIFAYKYFTKPLTPDQAAVRFMDAIKQGDLSKAYSYLDDSNFIGRDYLNEECFKKAFAKQKVTEYKLDTQVYGENPQTSFHYILNSGGERNEGNLILVNYPIKGKDNWKISPSAFIVDSQIQTLPDVTVKINGKSVNCENGSVSIPMFKDYLFTVKFEYPDAETLKVNTLAGEYTDGTNLEVKAAVQEDIKSQINDFFNVYNQTGTDYNTSHFDNIVKPDSSAWSNTEDWKNYLMGNQYTQEFKYNDIKIGNIRFDYNLKVILADIEWLQGSTVKDKDGNVIESQNAEAWSSTITLEKQDNGSWLIIDE